MPCLCSTKHHGWRVPPAGFSELTSTNATNGEPAVPEQAVPEPHGVMQPQHKCSEHAAAQAETWPGCPWRVPCAPLLAQPGGLESARRAGSKPISEQPQIKCLRSAPSAPAAAILLGAVYGIPSRASSHSPLQRARNCPKFSCPYSFSNNNKQRSREGEKKNNL